LTQETILLALFALVMSAAPLAMIRRSHRTWIALDAGSWIAIVTSLAGLQLTGRALEPTLVLAMVMAVKLAIFAGYLAVRREDDLRHDSWLIAAMVLAVYLIAGTSALRVAIDGDEPYYVLIAESMLHDRDLDLRNQYADPSESVVGRSDLVPQTGDPVGAGGEQYSRHEPFLSLLLVPGIALAGLWGAMATIALLAALAVRSLVRMLGEGGIGPVVVARVWPLIAFAPPMLFYAHRIWPEAPGALALTEAVRNAGKRRWGWMLLWLAALSLLKIRFALVALAMIAIVIVSARPNRRVAIAAAVVAIVPMAVAWLMTGNPLNIHDASELVLGPWWKYPRGAFGLLLDAQAGLLFQAPFWFAGFLGLLLFRRELPEPVRWAVLAAIPYLVLLFPRDEWHGGWAPPLRYLTVFMPLFAVGAALLARRAAGWIAPVGVASLILVVHGLAWPWRLFHIANGESVAGEWLSAQWSADFSRLFPSFIRPNIAAFLAAALLALGISLLLMPARWRMKVRMPPFAWPLAAAAVVVVGITAGMRPGSVVHFEDAHVERLGGELHPHLYQVGRFAYTGGWTMSAGDAVRFRMKPGGALLHAKSDGGARIESGGLEQVIPQTGGHFTPLRIVISGDRVEIRVLEGELTLDRIEHE
jgi:hypothetical protein